MLLRCLRITFNAAFMYQPCNQHIQHITASITIKLIAQNWVAKEKEKEIKNEFCIRVTYTNIYSKNINKKGLCWYDLQHLGNTYPCNVHLRFFLALHFPSFITQVVHLSYFLLLSLLLRSLLLLLLLLIWLLHLFHFFICGYTSFSLIHEVSHHSECTPHYYMPFRLHMHFFSAISQTKS